jgi:heat shock protein HslJ
MKHTTIAFLTLAIIGAVVFAAGCISSENETPAGNWILIGSGPAGTPATGIISLEITESNITGNSGVNNYFGSLIIGSDGKLTISGLGSTKMAGPGNLMTQEQSYYTALKNVTGYKIIEGDLILTDQNGNTLLTFASASSIPTGTWILNNTTGVTLSFLADGTMNGRAPVNSYFGNYTISVANGLVFTQIGSTLMAGDEQLMQEESSFFAALHNVSGYKIVNKTLVLSDKSGNTLLTFNETPAIIGKWLLASDKNVTLNFNAGGSCGGQAPVNVYGASYTLSGSTLSIGDDIISTMMAGTEEEMKAEFAFFGALKASAGYSIVDSTLTISDKDGKEILVLVRA